MTRNPLIQTRTKMGSRLLRPMCRRRLRSLLRQRRHRQLTVIPAKSISETAVLVLGSGPGGYTAAFRAADLGLETTLVERYDTLGGVCLNVGCIPSKALLHVAKVIDDADAMSAHGVKFGQPDIDATALRDWKNKVVGQLTQGLTGLAKQRKVRVVTGVGEFVSPYHLKIVGCGRRAGHSLRTVHHCRGFPGGNVAFPARRRSDHGFDRRIGTRRSAGQNAGDRRRHHRA